MVEAQINPVAVWRSQLDDRTEQIVAVLPEHIKVDRFKRTALAAAMQNPDLLTKCDRTSLFNAVMKAATDGLMPDGREGAVVAFKGKAQWMPMIAGLRKKVRQSGEISTWSAEVVYENDLFDYQLGDEPFIMHKPTLRDRGAPIAAYSIATLKTGEKSREVMTIEEIEKVREVSRTTRDDSPWNMWWEEMAKKTVARRHSKVLPMNTDLDAMMSRDNAMHGEPDPDAVSEAVAVATRPVRGLKGKLAQLANGPSEEAAKQEPEAKKASPPAPPPPAVQPVHELQHEPVDEIPPSDEIDEIPPHDDDGVIEEEVPEDEVVVTPVSAAYERGSQARREGYQRKAVPGEFRREDRAAEAEAWNKGWLDEHKRLAAATQLPR